MIESKRKGSASTSPQPEARHGLVFVDTAARCKLHGGGLALY